MFVCRASDPRSTQPWIQHFCHSHRWSRFVEGLRPPGVFDMCRRSALENIFQRELSTLRCATHCIGHCATVFEGLYVLRVSETLYKARRDVALRRARSAEPRLGAARAPGGGRVPVGRGVQLQRALCRWAVRVPPAVGGPALRVAAPRPAAVLLWVRHAARKSGRTPGLLQCETTDPSDSGNGLMRRFDAAFDIE